MNMVHLSPAIEHATWHGFEARILRSTALEVVVIPDLGAKVVSLKNLRSGREWMYHPNNSPKLFRNQPDDDFAQSPMIGWDECLPTIAPCTWRGRALPDHGEVWNTTWQLDEAAWQLGIIKTSVRSRISPFEFTRAIELHENTINVNYQLVNLSEEPQEFLWSMHPLLALQTGDRLALSPEIRQRLGQPAWLDTLDFNERNPACVKAFAGPLQQGEAEIFNVITGDSLMYKWDVADCNMLGVWLTRGGWNGHHHVALEPTNGSPDSLAVAAGQGKSCGRLAPQGTKQWKIQIQATQQYRSPALSAGLAETKCFDAMI